MNDGDDGEDEGPDQGEGHGQHCRHDPIQPQLGLSEKHVSQSPDGLEALGAQWLRQHVVEINLQKSNNNLMQVET